MKTVSMATRQHTVHIKPSLEQQQDDIITAILGSCHKCSMWYIRTLQKCRRELSCTQEQGHHLGVPLLAGHIKWCLTICIENSAVGLMGCECLHYSCMAILTRYMKRCVSTAASRVWVHTMAQQVLGWLHLPTPTSHMQGCVAPVVSNVQHYPKLCQLTDELGEVVGSTVVYDGAAILVWCIQILRKCLFLS